MLGGVKKKDQQPAELAPRLGNASYLLWPGSPIPLNSSVADGVELRLSLAFLFLPMFVWRLTRRFQVCRVFEAMTGGLYQAEGFRSTKPKEYAR
jgi:hypothetical protein